MKCARNGEHVGKYKKKVFSLFFKAMLISMYLLQKYTYTEFSFTPISSIPSHFPNTTALVHIPVASGVGACITNNKAES